MRLKEIKPGMVIHCKTEEEAKELMFLCDKKGLTWCTGEKASSNTRFSVLSDRTCYRIHEDHVTYDNYAHYSSENYIITEFSDLIIPELSAKEVLEIMGEICNSIHGCDSHCPTWVHCSHKEFGSKAEETIAICTKWREEHPKEEEKELETEWVYVVRIIKVHDNGKKECVHEVDYGRNEQKEFAFVDYFADDQLKKYCSENKGNFFAVYENICRIKE